MMINKLIFYRIRKESIISNLTKMDKVIVYCFILSTLVSLVTPTCSNTGDLTALSTTVTSCLCTNSISFDFSKYSL